MFEISGGLAALVQFQEYSPVLVHRGSADELNGSELDETQRAFSPSVDTANRELKKKIEKLKRFKLQICMKC